MKIVNMPNRRAFCRHTSPNFLERHPVFLRKIGLVWQQNPPRLVIFPFFKQGLTHDRGSSDCWNYYDNIESASVYFDEDAQMSCVAVRFKGADSDVVLGLSEVAYLCNDRGQTIEKLRPAVKQTESAEVHTVELTVGEPVGI